MSNPLSVYQQRLNLQNALFSRIEHEDAMVAVVYKVVHPNGAQLILKISERPNDYLREVYFLNYFAGKLPVPGIVQVVAPAPSIHGAILMECLPGSLIKKADLTDTLTYEIGALLAHIHLHRTNGYGDLIEPKKLSPDPKMHFAEKFYEGLEECTGHFPNTLIDQCRRYFDTHLPLLVNADGPCIVHRDFRPGNLLVEKGEIQGLIDWASARASFAEEDFCSMEHGEWCTDLTTKNAFLAGYASVRPLPDYHAFMPLLRLSKAIATIGFTVKRGTWEKNHTRLYQWNRQFLEALICSH